MTTASAALGRPSPRVDTAGVVAVGAFSLFSAALDVYAGNVLQRIDPMLLMFLCFTSAWAVFTARELLRRSRFVAIALERPSDVLALNLTTAVTWVGLFYALKYVEPALVNGISVAIGPICTIILGRYLRRQSRVLQIEWCCAAGIFITVLLLSWSSIARAPVSGARTLLGLVSGVASGVFAAGSLIYSKRLAERGLSASAIMSVRFLLLIGVTFALSSTAIGGALVRLDIMIPALSLSIIGIVFPLYLLQVGIQRLEPVSVALIVTAAPILTFLLQMFDDRIAFSVTSLALIVLITLLVSTSVVARYKMERSPQ
ncbi:hypothetical protein AB3662_28975 [Sorangium cellulosum]|uniref:hypothetical protein n=1 Tax=Sorangium cellulosum TaxID=56 RepID=UPI003D9A23D3